MVVLRECDCFGYWPVHVATEPVGPSDVVPVASVVHFLEVELKFVFVRDGYIGSDESALFVVQTFAECSEVLVPIPFCVVGVFQCFPGFDVERAPAAVKMVQDLEGGDVAISREAILEL